MRIPQRPRTTLGMAASSSTIVPTGVRSTRGASSLRKSPIAIASGTAMSSATSAVTSVPKIRSAAPYVVLDGVPHARGQEPGAELLNRRLGLVDDLDDEEDHQRRQPQSGEARRCPGGRRRRTATGGGRSEARGLLASQWSWGSQGRKRRRRGRMAPALRSSRFRSRSCRSAPGRLQRLRTGASDTRGRDRMPGPSARSRTAGTPSASRPWASPAAR